MMLEIIILHSNFGCKAPALVDLDWLQAFVLKYSVNNKQNSVLNCLAAVVMILFASSATEAMWRIIIYLNSSLFYLTPLSVLFEICFFKIAFA